MVRRDTMMTVVYNVDLGAVEWCLEYFSRCVNVYGVHHDGHGVDASL